MKCTCRVTMEFHTSATHWSQKDAVMEYRWYRWPPVGGCPEHGRSVKLIDRVRAQ